MQSLSYKTGNIEDIKKFIDDGDNYYIPNDLKKKNTKRD
jgi:hypothetical protein